ncbi:phosphotransferase family protein [Rhodococcus sp. X156]|uniref:phosphotransferase family protein n=1 Tax=Rhodococcus sp. X156 TaxID=2499145 RepID=UPI000FDC73AD|nr:phosphotransferase family protein [Rhodococcus sp. X156]
MTNAQVVGLDPHAVTEWFDSLGLQRQGRLSFERVGLGQSNLVFLVQDEGRGRWVLRRPPLGHLLASAHDVAREGRILSALQDTAVPTPRVHGLYTPGAGSGPAVSEVPLLLMEFVDGRVVDRMSVAEALTPEQRRAIGVSLPRTLATIHAVDLDATGLADLASHKPYAARQLKRWGGQWEQSRTRELPELDDLTARLAAAVPEQHELTLVHGDFHLRNVIAAADTGEVVAALDWELCTLGEPLADVGTLLAYWPEPGEDTGGDFPASALPGFPSRAEIAEIYLAETGRDAAALAYWHALGLWKVAIIAEGVMRRARDEPQNAAASGTPTVARIDQLVAKAREVADHAGI